MNVRRGWVGLGAVVFVVGCGAPSADGGSGTAGVGGYGGYGGTAGTAGTGGAAGAAGWGVSGSGAFGGFGGYSGSAGTAGGDSDAGVECPVNEYCGPTSPDEEGCGTLRLEAEVEEVLSPGNLLVIFDRSGSMDSDWNGTPKYQVAGNALMNALMPLQDVLTVGGVFFPSIDTAAAGNNCDCSNPINWIPGIGGCCLMGSRNSCVVNTIDQPDQISFRPGPQFIAEVPNQWRLQGASSTPLQTAVERGAQALANAVYDGPMSVLIVTDGAPNCGTDGTAVLNQITQWASQGIATHVIGLPGAQNAATLLNQLAAAGGTTNYIDPANAADLEMRLRSIVESTIMRGFDSCSITLNPAAELPDKLQLVVVEEGMEFEAARDLGTGGGWSVSANGANVELTGAFCDNAQAGVYQELRFKFGCEDLPQLPPPVPPE